MQKLLKEKGLDGSLFIFPIDVYYYAGTRQNSTLWMPAEGEPMLLVRKSYLRAKEESPLADIRPFPSSKDFPALLGDHLKKIGFTFDVAPVQQLNFYSKLLPGREFIDISGPHRELRSVKSAFELEQLRLAGAASCSVFAAIPEFLKRGMREIDVAAEIECRLRKAGSEGYVRMRAYNQELFMGLAVSAGAASYGFIDGPVTGRGLSSASPHGASRELVRENEPILLDYSFVRERLHFRYGPDVRLWAAGRGVAAGLRSGAGNPGRRPEGLETGRRRRGTVLHGGRDGREGRFWRELHGDAGRTGQVRRARRRPGIG